MYLNRKALDTAAMKLDVNVLRYMEKVAIHTRRTPRLRRPSAALQPATPQKYRDAPRALARVGVARTGQGMRRVPAALRVVAAPKREAGPRF